MKLRNKELKEHIKKNKKAGAFDNPSKSNQRMRERHDLDCLKDLYNNDYSEEELYLT